jgi:hypothetical protein
MFRSLFKAKQNKKFFRAFSDSKLPEVKWRGDGLNTLPNKIGTMSELKEDNPNWKATNGDGKSIYDCENKSWCIPKGEPLVRTYKKINVKLDMDEHIGPEWIDANCRED